MLFGTGQVWGQNFGYITYTQGTDDGGSLAFYKDADCTSGNEISITNGKSDNLSGLDADGKVYIKVTPDESHQSRGVTITVEKEATGDPIRNVPWWNGEGNAPRRQAPSYNETITVETVAYGIYCFVMPDDGSNVTVTATFPTKTALTITADSDSKTYDGMALTKNTYTSTVLAEGDIIESVTVTGSQTEVGSSDNVPSAAVIKNASNVDVTDCYSITYVNGTLTVNACQSSEAVVALDIPTEGYTYDGTEKTPAVTVTIGGVTVDATEYTVSYADHVNAGTATVTVDDKPGGNYAFAPVSKTFEIGKATVTVTAADQTKGYGDADPELTYTAAGLVGSDGISGTLGRTAGEDVGNYAILLGSLDAGSNYTLILAGNGAKLTITKKSLKDSNIEISITNYASCSIAVKQDGVLIAADNNYTATKHATKENTVTITGTGNYAGEIDVTLVSADFEKPADAATDADCCAAAQVSQDMALPEGMVAVMLTGTDPQKGIATAKALDYIPAGVPVILMKKDDADGFTAKDITPGTASGTTEVTDADKAACPLKVADSNTAALQGYQDYVWFKGELVLVSNTAKPVSGTFYVKNSNTSTPAPKLQIVIGEEEETTSLPSIDHSSLTIDHSEGAWFSLDGRKINGQPLKKGLYIHNGKKTVIK